MKHSHKGKSSESHLDKDTILRELDIRAGLTILDAGCGNGYMAKEFARVLEDAGEVLALDIDAEAIEALRTEAGAAGIEAMVGDITKRTPLVTSSIDLIYLSAVFHGFSVDEIQGFRKEARRLLKPGGRLAVVEFRNVETPFGPPLDIRLSPDDLIEAVKLAPLAIVEVGEYFFMQVFGKDPEDLNNDRE